MSQYHSPPSNMFPSHFWWVEGSVNSFDARRCKSEAWNLVMGRFSKLVFYFTRIWKYNLITYSYIDVVAKSTILKRYIHWKDINLRPIRLYYLTLQVVIVICTKNKDLSSEFKSDFFSGNSEVVNYFKNSWLFVTVKKIQSLILG